MKLLIFFFAAFAVTYAEDAKNENKTCVKTWRYNIYLEKKSCLKSYMGSVIRDSSASSRRRRDVIPAPDASNSTSITGSDKKNCSSLNEVKEFFKEKWVNLSKNISSNLTAEDFKVSNEIRIEILDNLLQEKRLKEFKKDDFACIKKPDINQYVLNECVIKVLKTADSDVDKIPLRIKNVMAKPFQMIIKKLTCKNNIKVSSCVQNALTNCSNTVQKFVSDLDSMMSKRCEPILSMKTPEPVKKTMSTKLIVVIVLVCVCISLAAGYGVYKILKMRRNRGLHSVTRSSPEKCEMSSMTKATARD